MSKTSRSITAAASSKSHTLLATTALGLSLIAPSVYAQSAEPKTEFSLEEITVTAQRREQSLQDVPVSVSAFTSTAIERNNFQGVDDYLSRTPNVSFISSGGRDRKSISIRGITNFLSVDQDVRPSTVAFYLDDFSVGGGSVNPPMMDIERIEVLRGPQGTYFGRNAVGGAINVTTKKPDNDLFAQAKIGYSSFDTKDVEAIINVPIVQDVLAIRGNMKWTKTDGNIENINPIGGGNDSEYINGRTAIRYTPTDRLTVDVNVSVTDEVSGMREGVPSGVFSEFAGNTLFGYLNGQPDPDGVGFYPENRDKVNFNRPQEVGTHFWYTTGKVAYDFDEITLTSITGYMDSKGFLAGDIDGGSVDGWYETKDLYRTSLSQELRLQSTGSSDLEWVIGGLLARDKGNVEQYTYAGAENAFGLPEGTTVTETQTNGKTTSVAVFGEATYHLTDRLSVTGGLRWTHEKIDSVQVNVSGGIISDSVDETASFSDISPKVSVGYSINDNTTAYATVSKAFKSGGVQTNQLLPDKTYDPETLWNFEAGLKSELLDRRLRMNIAAFYMKWKDLQTEFQDGIINENGDIAFVTGIENADSARSYGVEAEFTGLVTENLTMGASIGYLNAKYENFVSYIEGQNYTLDGYTIPNSPKWTLSGDAEYTFPVVGDYEGYIRAEWFYRGDTVSNKDYLIKSGFPYEVPDYNSTNVRVGMGNDQYSIVAYVENVFDNNYYTNAYQKAFVGGLFVEPSVRTVGIRLSFKTN
ncbi:TonB-dependent receptor [Kordiimonas sp.]|uniref:TonB-dependent receptor n=1 Tax=Kordiimonas sp. TaxID=1970157 RepID=UPI003A8E6133